MHKHAVEHAPGIDIKPERNIADAENRLNIGQFFLDSLDRIQRLDSCRPILLLASRNRQRERIENQIDCANAIFVRRQIGNAVRDCNFLVRGERHAIFVDGERDHRRAIALGHRQNFGCPLLTIF